MLDVSRDHTPGRWCCGGGGGCIRVKLLFRYQIYRGGVILTLQGGGGGLIFNLVKFLFCYQIFRGGGGDFDPLRGDPPPFFPPLFCPGMLKMLDIIQDNV